MSHLPAVEELGGMDVLCCDKTGTLTANRLSLVAEWTVEGVSRDELLLCAALASRAEDRDPIDLAVLGATPDSAGAAGHRVTAFSPFDPVSKRTEARVEGPDGSFLTSKGAPQVILALVEADETSLRAQAMGAVEEFARRGSRSLGVARTDEDGTWRFLGLVALEDPPRDDSRATIAEAKGLGVDVRMVTGDQLAIARQIATEVGLGAEIVDAEVLTEHAPDDGDVVSVSDLVEGADGFGQVFPEHKYQIVELLQHRGHIVGMTGDGVNDAPALKQADAGIAVSGATDAARAAADVVLLAPGLSVIVTAIRTAREIFQRMTTYAIYRIAETIRVLLLITLSILIFDFFPVTPVMIVLLALLNDGAILSIAYDRAEGSERPEAWDMTTVLGIATALGVIGVVASFGLVVLADKVFSLDRSTIQTLLYLKLSVAGHLTIFLTRTRGPFWTRPHPARILLLAVIGTQVVATFVAVYGVLVTPIGWDRAALVWCYALAWFFVNDRIKLAVYGALARRRARSRHGRTSRSSHMRRNGPEMTQSATSEPRPLGEEELHRIDAYWRAANYLSVGQIYLMANPLLREPLRPEHVKPRLLGHWGTTPGLNFIYAHLNRVIRARDTNMIFICGPGHGGPAVVANTYLEGTYSERYADVTLDEEGLRRLFRQFSFPGGIPSHAAPETPGSINEGGELGYSLAHAFGAVFDNPDLVAACVIGDGEAETGALATAWHGNKFLDPRHRRRRAAGAAPERIQDRQSNRAGSHRT